MAQQRIRTTTAPLEAYPARNLPARPGYRAVQPVEAGENDEYMYDSAGLYAYAGGRSPALVTEFLQNNPRILRSALRAAGVELPNGLDAAVANNTTFPGLTGATMSANGHWNFNFAGRTTSVGRDGSISTGTRCENVNIVDVPIPPNIPIWVREARTNVQVAVKCDERGVPLPITMPTVQEEAEAPPAPPVTLVAPAQALYAQGTAEELQAQWDVFFSRHGRPPQRSVAYNSPIPSVPGDDLRGQGYRADGRTARSRVVGARVDVGDGNGPREYNFARADREIAYAGERVMEFEVGENGRVNITGRNRDRGDNFKAESAPRYQVGTLDNGTPILFAVGRDGSATIALDAVNNPYYRNVFTNVDTGRFTVNRLLTTPGGIAAFDALVTIAREEYEITSTISAPGSSQGTGRLNIARNALATNPADTAAQAAVVRETQALLDLQYAKLMNPNVWSMVPHSGLQNADDVNRQIDTILADAPAELRGTILQRYEAVGLEAARRGIRPEPLIAAARSLTAPPLHDANAALIDARLNPAEENEETRRYVLRNFAEERPGFLGRTDTPEREAQAREFYERGSRTIYGNDAGEAVTTGIGRGQAWRAPSETENLGGLGALSRNIGDPDRMSAHQRNLLAVGRATTDNGAAFNAYMDMMFRGNGNPALLERNLAMVWTATADHRPGDYAGSEAYRMLGFTSDAQADDFARRFAMARGDEALENGLTYTNPAWSLFGTESRGIANVAGAVTNPLIRLVTLGAAGNNETVNMNDAMARRYFTNMREIYNRPVTDPERIQMIQQFSELHQRINGLGQPNGAADPTLVAMVTPTMREMEGDGRTRTPAAAAYVAAVTATGVNAQETLIMQQSIEDAAVLQGPAEIAAERLVALGRNVVTVDRPTAEALARAEGGRLPAGQGVITGGNARVAATVTAINGQETLLSIARDAELSRLALRELSKDPQFRTQLIAELRAQSRANSGNSSSIIDRLEAMNTPPAAFNQTEFTSWVGLAVRADRGDPGLQPGPVITALANSPQANTMATALLAPNSAVRTQITPVYASVSAPAAGPAAGAGAAGSRGAIPLTADNAAALVAPLLATDNTHRGDSKALLGMIAARDPELALNAVRNLGTRPEFRDDIIAALRTVTPAVPPEAIARLQADAGNNRRFNFALGELLDNSAATTGAHDGKVSAAAVLQQLAAQDAAANDTNAGTNAMLATLNQVPNFSRTMIARLNSNAYRAELAPALGVTPATLVPLATSASAPVPSGETIATTLDVTTAYASRDAAARVLTNDTRANNDPDRLNDIMSVLGVYATRNNPGSVSAATTNEAFSAMMSRGNPMLVTLLAVQQGAGSDANAEALRNLIDRFDGRSNRGPRDEITEHLMDFIRDLRRHPENAQIILAQTETWLGEYASRNSENMQALIDLSGVLAQNPRLAGRMTSLAMPAGLTAGQVPSRDQLRSLIATLPVEDQNALVAGLQDPARAQEMLRGIVANMNNGLLAEGGLDSGEIIKLVALGVYMGWPSSQITRILSQVPVVPPVKIPGVGAGPGTGVPPRPTPGPTTVTEGSSSGVNAGGIITAVILGGNLPGNYETRGFEGTDAARGGNLPPAPPPSLPPGSPGDRSRTAPPPN